MLDAEDMRMELGRARREDQTPGCWGARTGGEGEDGGPRKGETALPGAADAGGLARTSFWAAPLGFAHAGDPMVGRHSVGPPEAGRGRGGKRHQRPPASVPSRP